MNRSYLVAAALGLALAGTAAQAADPLPDSLSLGGVTLYGTIDIGYAYQNHGVPSNGQLPGNLEYQSFTTTRNFAGSVSTVASSGLEQSKIGIRVAQPVADDWSLVGRVETGINPTSGQLTDACASLASNAGKAQGSQTANADSSRCGQFFNAQAFGGAASPTVGQLTIGRHNSLMLDALASYDPQALSYAFSFLGYSGFTGGSGSTEAARWNNSVRYSYSNPQFHLALLYSSGSQDGGLLDNAFGANLGFVVQGLSIDAVYQRANGAVNLRSSFDDPTAGSGNPPVPAGGLAAYISDDTSYSLMAKYSFDLADKDKFNVYAGYSHIEKANSSDANGNAQGDYLINIGININNSAEYNVLWVGGRFIASGGLNLVAAYYHISQNSWTIGLGTNGTQGVGCVNAGLLCSGDFTEASFVIDYVFNKHYDLYAGVNYSQVTDGLASGFVGTPGANATTGSQSQTTFMVGGRVKF
jgi:predicted porin